MNLLMNKDQFQRWWEHPGTEAYLAYLDRRRLNLMEAWARGLPLEPEDQMEAYLCSQMKELSPERVAVVFNVELSEEEDDGRTESN